MEEGEGSNEQCLLDKCEVLALVHLVTNKKCNPPYIVFFNYINSKIDVGTYKMISISIFFNLIKKNYSIAQPPTLTLTLQ